MSWLFRADARPPNVPEDEATYREALTRASGLRMRPLVAHCHFGLGPLYQRTGDRVKAEEHLQTATTMSREMGMTFWLEKAAAEMPKLPPPPVPRSLP